LSKISLSSNFLQFSAQNLISFNLSENNSLSLLNGLSFKLSDKILELFKLSIDDFEDEAIGLIVSVEDELSVAQDSLAFEVKSSKLGEVKGGDDTLISGISLGGYTGDIPSFSIITLSTSALLFGGKLSSGSSPLIYPLIVSYQLFVFAIISFQ
jgi:hypothetical protein